VRFNRDHGREGHVWGNRYKSEILDGEPPPDAERYVFDETVYCENRRARRAQRARGLVADGLGKIAATDYPARGVGGCPLASAVTSGAAPDGNAIMRRPA
jgi:hypothetical protein